MSASTLGAIIVPGAVAHYWRGDINVNAALLFGVSGIAGCFLGSYLTDSFLTARF
jgi:uncharacterized membrane protein YfcA